MLAWLVKTFPPIGNGQVLVYITPDGNQVSFDPTDPNGLFSTLAGAPPTYAALSMLPCANEGWQAIFDHWKANGKVA